MTNFPIEEQHKLMESCEKLTQVIYEEVKWLEECPFRHGEYFYETAEETLKSQKRELCKWLRTLFEEELAAKIEAHDGSTEFVMSDSEFWNEIKADLSAIS